MKKIYKNLDLFPNCHVANLSQAIRGSTPLFKLNRQCLLLSHHQPQHPHNHYHQCLLIILILIIIIIQFYSAAESSA